MLNFQDSESMDEDKKDYQKEFFGIKLKMSMSKGFIFNIIL